MGIRNRLLEIVDAGDVAKLRHALASTPGLFSEAECTEALQWAAKDGRADFIRELAPLSNPRAHNSAALRMAAEQGRSACVRELIPISDPKANDSEALKWAAHNGRIECVRQLIPVSDPKASDSFALLSAALGGHVECVDALLPHSDVEIRNEDGFTIAEAARRSGVGIRAAERIEAYILAMREEKAIEEATANPTSLKGQKIRI